MKFRFILSVFVLISVSFATAATQAVYVNSSPVVSPPGTAPVIDATEFINESDFEINVFTIPSFPYQTANTVHFRNEPGARMFGHPGYLFEYIHGNVREPMLTWQNRGTISSFPNPDNLIFGGIGANWLLVSSDSIFNSGS